MATINIPPEMAPFVRRLNVDRNDYEANKAMAAHLVSNKETVSQSLEFFSRALAHNRTDDPDHQRMLEAFSEVLIIEGDFEAAFKPLLTLVTTYPSHNLKHILSLAHTCFRTGRVDVATDVTRKIVGHLYEAAIKRSEETGEPITQLLMPDSILRTHFGELAVKLDLYGKARVLGLAPVVRARLPILEDEVVNGCLYECIKKSISDVVSFPASAEERDSWVAENPGHLWLEYYVDPEGRGFDHNHFFVLVQRLWEESGREPLVKLPEKYSDAGWELLRKHGLPEDGWFACFHARDGGYRSDIKRGLTHYRNSNIEDYIPAMEAIRDRGGWVVRVGDSSMPPLPEMEGVIDYAVSDSREDWIDVFLLARNRFFVGATSGPITVAQVFGVPVVGVSWFPFEDWMYSSSNIMVFKPYRRSSDGSYLTVSEMTKPPVRGLLSKGSFDARGIEVEENSPEDVRAAVVEMMDQCDGVIDYSDEDEDLQRRFKALADPFSVGVNVRFGRDFLRRHRSIIG